MCDIDLLSDLTKLLDNQVLALHESHRQQIEELKLQHVEESRQMKVNLSVTATSTLKL